MNKNLFGVVTNTISAVGKKIKKESFFDKLIKEDTNVSMMNFFLMAILAVGVILLFVPVVGMLVDIWYNHTMTINMSDMALYVGAVSAIFTAGGLSSACTEWAYSKYKIPVITEEDMARREEARSSSIGTCDEPEEDITEK